LIHAASGTVGRRISFRQAGIARLAFIAFSDGPLRQAPARRENRIPPRIKSAAQALSRKML
jgi:hypothetical protein